MNATTNHKKAVAYFRTSSATNVGADKDSAARQRQACSIYAREHGLAIEREFYDADVKGSLDHLDRAGFAAMVSYCMEHAIATVLCEDATRFSRDLTTQERGYEDMKRAGLTLIPVNMPTLFLDDTLDPSRAFLRQVLGAVAQYEKNSLVLKLRGARERKRKANAKRGITTIDGKGKCEGRKRIAETNLGLIRIIKRLARKTARGYLSFRGIARELERGGFVSATGKAYNPNQVKRLLVQAGVNLDKREHSAIAAGKIKNLATQ